MGISTMVHAVKDMDDFNNQLTAAGGKLVVVDFFATWCGPCKMVAPHLEEMSKTMDDVVFLKVDVDDCETLLRSTRSLLCPLSCTSRTSPKWQTSLGPMWRS